MCYSAQIRQDYRKFIREVGARIDIAEFVRLYRDRKAGSKARIPRAMDAMFLEPRNDEEREIAALIAARCLVRPTCVLHSALSFHSGLPSASQSRAHKRDELAAMFMWPSLAGKTPVGVNVG